eukprot:Em0008g638a
MQASCVVKAVTTKAQIEVIGKHKDVVIGKPKDVVIGKPIAVIRPNTTDQATVRPDTTAQVRDRHDTTAQVRVRAEHEEANTNTTLDMISAIGTRGDAILARIDHRHSQIVSIVTGLRSITAGLGFTKAEIAKHRASDEHLDRIYARAKTIATNNIEYKSEDDLISIATSEAIFAATIIENKIAANTDAHSDAPTDAHSGAHTDAHSGAHTDAHSGAHTDAHTDAHSGAHIDAHTDAHIDAHIDAHSDAHIDAHIDAHSDAHNIITRDAKAGYIRKLDEILASLGEVEDVPVTDPSGITSADIRAGRDAAIDSIKMSALTLLQTGVIAHDKGVTAHYKGVKHSLHHIDQMCVNDPCTEKSTGPPKAKSGSSGNFLKHPQRKPKLNGRDRRVLSAIARATQGTTQSAIQGTTRGATQGTIQSETIDQVKVEQIAINEFLTFLRHDYATQDRCLYKIESDYFNYLGGYLEQERMTFGATVDEFNNTTVRLNLGEKDAIVKRVIVLLKYEAESRAKGRLDREEKAKIRAAIRFSKMNADIAGCPYGDYTHKDYVSHYIKSLPDCLPGGLPEYMPDGLPEGAAEYASSGLPGGLPEYMPDGLPEGAAEYASSGLPGGLPEYMPDGLPEGAAEYAAGYVPEGAAEGQNGYVPEGAAENYDTSDSLSDAYNPVEGYGLGQSIYEDDGILMAFIEEGSDCDAGCEDCYKKVTSQNLAEISDEVEASFRNAIEAKAENELYPFLMSDENFRAAYEAQFEEDYRANIAGILKTQDFHCVRLDGSAETQRIEEEEIVEAINYSLIVNTTVELSPHEKKEIINRVRELLKVGAENRVNIRREVEQRIVAKYLSQLKTNCSTDCFTDCPTNCFIDCPTDDQAVVEGHQDITDEDSDNFRYREAFAHVLQELKIVVKKTVVKEGHQDTTEADYANIITTSDANVKAIEELKATCAAKACVPFDIPTGDRTGDRTGVPTDSPAHTIARAIASLGDFIQSYASTTADTTASTTRCNAKDILTYI